MFYVIRRPRTLVNFVNFLLVKNQRFANTIRAYSYFINYSSPVRLCSAVQSKGFLMISDPSRLTLTRNKHDKKKKRQKYQDEESSDEEDEEEDDDDVFVEKGAEIKTYSVKSLRIDSILKLGLGVSRHKIENAFYENKIRVNGEIIQKKSQNAKLNDELDLIKGYAGGHTDSIVVGRLKILKVQPDSDTGNLVVKLWKCKNLTVKNYSASNAWREPTIEE